MQTTSSSILVPIGSATFARSHAATKAKVHQQAQAQGQGQQQQQVEAELTSSSSFSRSSNNNGNTTTSSSSNSSNSSNSSKKIIIITQINAHDVLCGRGGETNQHTGNVRYRQLVRERQVAYLQARRGEKPKISEYVVNEIHRNGGRFLKRIDHNHSSSNDQPQLQQYQWIEVSDQKAREKTSQALREKAPEIRKAVAVAARHTYEDRNASVNHISGSGSSQDISDVSSLFGATSTVLPSSNTSPCPWTTNVTDFSDFLNHEPSKHSNTNSVSCDTFVQLCLPPYFAYHSPGGQNSFSSLVPSSSVAYTSCSPVGARKKRSHDDDADSSDQNNCDNTPTRGPRFQLFKRRSSVNT